MCVSCSPAFRPTLLTRGYFSFLIFHPFSEAVHLGTKSSRSWLILTMAPLSGLNLIPSSFLPSFFPPFSPFSSPLTPSLLPSSFPAQTQGRLEGFFLAGEGGPWGLLASRVGVSGKNRRCQESGGQELPKCFLVSHKGDGDFFFF